MADSVTVKREQTVSSLKQYALRIPLFYKILLANSAIVALGAVAGTVITVWHVISYPEDLHYELIIIFAVAGFVISFVVNNIVLKLTLAPLDRLQAAVDEVRRGNLDVRVETDGLSDERFDRLIATFNQMLDTIEQDARQLHDLSHRMMAAQEEERQRVARELHDEAAQALTSLLVHLRLLERSPTPEQAREHVHELRELTAQALEEVRRVALDLRPKILDDLGLEAALEWRVDEFNAAYDTEATLRVAGIADRLPKALELVLYRVTQEALNNVGRHACAAHVSIEVTCMDDYISLNVRDDGAGFNVAAQAGAPTGLGLMGMRERMTMIGGDISIDSQPGAGTCLSATAPLDTPFINGSNRIRGREQCP